MKLQRLFGLCVCFAITSCAALFPFEEKDHQSGKNRNGNSLDSPPNGQSRYMGEPRTDTPDVAKVDGTLPPESTLQPVPKITDPVTTPTPPVTPKPPVPAQASYGKMVPGRVGFVYPPGVGASPENMVDVRGFSPGEKVRDPRTGKVFLVP